MWEDWKEYLSSPNGQTLTMLAILIFIAIIT